MKFRNLTPALTATWLAMVGVPAFAIDTDIFINAGADNVKAAPNVLLMMDNTSNYNNTFRKLDYDADERFADNNRSYKGAIVEAMHTVLRCVKERIDADPGGFNVNLGFMGLSDGTPAVPQGGKVHRAVQALGEGGYIDSLLADYFYHVPPKEGDDDILNNDPDEFDDLGNPINLCLKLDYVYNKGSDEEPNIKQKDLSWWDDHPDAPSGPGSAKNIKLEAASTQLTTTMIHEAYLYFAGEKPYASFGGHSSLSGKPDKDEYFDPGSLVDPDSFASNYFSPIEANGNDCGENYLIYIAGVNDPSNASGGDGAQLDLFAETVAAKLEIPKAEAISRIKDNLIDIADIDNGGDGKQLDELNYANEYSRFLSSIDVNDQVSGVQSLTTFVIDLHNPNRADDDLRPYLKSIALESGGKYFAATQVKDVAKALLDILSEIQAENAVFASAALPVSVNTRGTNLNQVYMGLFRPDANNRPLWAGNLKAYKLGIDGGKLQLQDNSVPPKPVEGTKGFIGPEVKSFWTEGSGDYWDFNSEYTNSDVPDGAIVEKGGIAQQMRIAGASDGVSQRNIYTCIGCEGVTILDGVIKTPGDELSLNPFTHLHLDSKTGTLCDAKIDGADADSTKFDLDSGSNRCTHDDTDAGIKMVKWLRGEDVLDARSGVSSSGTGDTTEPRPLIHGDVLHSRPVAVNYNRFRDEALTTCVDVIEEGRDLNTGEVACDDVVVFYGQNNGMLTAVQGGLDPNQAGANFIDSAGSELWSFVAPEFFPKLGQLYDNAPLPGGSPPTTIDRQFYFDGDMEVFTYDHDFDGSGVAHPDRRLERSGLGGFIDADTGAFDDDAVVLYSTMRRGGDMIYAFDVTDPAAPLLLWKKRGPVTSGAFKVVGNSLEQVSAALDPDPGYLELGQTWSKPAVTRLKNVDVNLDGDIDEMDTKTPVLIMGKGYSPLTDDEKKFGDKVDLSLISGSADIQVGAGIMVINGLTGDVIWQVGPADLTDTAVTGLLNLGDGEYRYEPEMTYSVPSSVTVVDRGIDGTGGDDDGFADFAYFADTGGQLWKVDLRVLKLDDPTTLVADEEINYFGQVSRIADVGGNRVFLYPPAVVTGRINPEASDLPFDTCGAFDAILIGSGNREDPFGTSVEDRFYMFKDHYFPGNKLNSARCSTSVDPERDEKVGYQFPTEWSAPADGEETDAMWDQFSEDDKPYTENDLLDITANQLQEAENALGLDPDNTTLQGNVAEAKRQLDQANGWFITFDNVDEAEDPTPGEKVVSQARTFAGTVFFNTNTPATEASGCGADLGIARQYAVNFFTGSAVYDNKNVGVLNKEDRWLKFDEGGFPPSPVHVIVEIDGVVLEGTCTGPHCISVEGSSFNQRKPIYWYQDIDEAL